jgi:very-short-patch-repair endonuclease
MKRRLNPGEGAHERSVFDGGGCHAERVPNNDGNKGPGVATLGQLTKQGGSRRRVRRLVRQGRLVTVRRGVYTTAGRVAEGTADQARREALRVAAVLTALSPGAVGSHRSAALIHGLDLLGRGDPPEITVTRPPGHGSRSLRRGVSVHAARLPGHHLVVRDGVLLTSVARTVVDLARTGSFTDGVVAADSALRSGRTTIAEMNAVLVECAGWPGIRRAREVAEFSDANSESALESIGRVAFHERGLPAPRLQAWVGGDQGVVGRADYYWPEHGTIAEADGAIKYADPKKAISQLDRDTRLRDEGFEVVHFTWWEITTIPDQVVARIQAAFDRHQALRAAQGSRRAGQVRRVPADSRSSQASLTRAVIDASAALPQERGS